MIWRDRGVTPGARTGRRMPFGWCMPRANPLTLHLSQVARWLSTLCTGRRMVLGAYAYVDGARFVKIVAAMDALMEHVRATRASEVCVGHETILNHTSRAPTVSTPIRPPFNLHGTVDFKVDVGCRASTVGERVVCSHSSLADTSARGGVY